MRIGSFSPSAFYEESKIVVSKFIFRATLVVPNFRTFNASFNNREFVGQTKEAVKYFFGHLIHEKVSRFAEDFFENIRWAPIGMAGLGVVTLVLGSCGVLYGVLGCIHAAPHLIPLAALIIVLALAKIVASFIIFHRAYEMHNEMKSINNRNLI